MYSQGHKAREVVRQKLVTWLCDIRLIRDHVAQGFTIWPIKSLQIHYYTGHFATAYSYVTSNFPNATTSYRSSFPFQFFVKFDPECV